MWLSVPVWDPGGEDRSGLPLGKLPRTALPLERRKLTCIFASSSSTHWATEVKWKRRGWNPEEVRGPSARATPPHRRCSGNCCWERPHLKGCNGGQWGDPVFSPDHAGLAGGGATEQIRKEPRNIPRGCVVFPAVLGGLGKNSHPFFQSWEMSPFIYPAFDGFPHSSLAQPHRPNSDPDTSHFLPLRPRFLTFGDRSHTLSHPPAELLWRLKDNSRSRASVTENCCTHVRWL